MPYQKKDDLPDAVKALPAHGQEIWMAAFNSAFEQYKDEGKAAATAWAAVKNKYKKEGDKWVPNSELFSEFPEWIEVFRAGRWTSAEGHTDDWTLDDLKEIAESYDPKTYEAPIVIGHPGADSPAYGWVESLMVDGEKLLAKPGKLVNEFKDWVKRGLYKKISISLFPDMTLRHIGFLGGAAPAVKGLAPISFNKKKPGWVFETDIPGDSAAAATGDAAVDNTSKKGGNIMYEWLTKMKEAIGLAEKQLAPDPSVKFTEADVSARVKETEEKLRKETEATFAEAQKKIEAEKKEKETAQAKLKEIEDKARKESIASFCETLCKEGKLTPALRKIIEPVMIAVSEIPELIEFSEGVKKSRLDGIKDFLTEIPKVVIFKEVAGSDGPGSGGTAAEKLSALTKKKMNEKKDLSYGSAFAEVQKENPELAKELLAEIRPLKT
jgi:cation transport regulator ChaB